MITDKESTFKDKEYSEIKGHPTFDQRSTIFGRALVQKNIENTLRRRRIRGLINEKGHMARALIKKVGRQSSLFRPHLNDLIELLSDILGTQVELEIVQLKYPYHDSNIFAQYLGVKARKLTYGRIKNKIIKKIPVSLSNLNSKTKNKNYVLKGGKKMSTLSAFKFGVGLGSSAAFESESDKRLEVVRPIKQKKAKLLSLVSSPYDHTLRGNNFLAKSKNNIGKSILNLSKSKLVSISKVKNLKRGSKATINLNVQMSLRKAKALNKKGSSGEKRQQIASKLTGIKVRIAGRLARQRVVPKRTVKTTYKGAISRSINNLVDSATFTDKNKKGAFSIRVWLSHRIKK